MKNRIEKSAPEPKYNRCMYLLLIPVFFFSANLFMGKRSKQSGYTKLGIFYGISSLVTISVSALGLVWPAMLYALISHAVVWMLCAVHTINSRQQYSQYVQWEQEDAPERSALVKDESFRRRNLLWCFWDCIPFLGGLATFHIGRKIKKPAVMWFGVLSTLLVVGLYFYFTMYEQIDNGVLIALSLVIAYCSICVHPLIFAYYFEEYMDVSAAEWTEDLEEYPQMESRGWRLRNSFWQLFTLAPMFGSLGLFWAGITRENGRVLGVASLLCILEVGSLAVPGMIINNTALLEAYPFMEGVAAAISSLWIFIYALIVFAGAYIRQDMLRIRAEQEIRF